MRSALIISIAAGWVMAQPASDLERARNLYQKTEYRAAIGVLERSSPAGSGAAWGLLGQCWYQEGDFKKSVQAFEKAVAAEPGNSRYHNWLGRAWGRRAETSNPIVAPGYASNARKHFEEAVRLDSKNLEAAGDLLTYYLEAPGILGGGIEKAATLAERIGAVDPAEYNFALAQIAERKRQLDLAEKLLRRAIDLAPRQAGRIVELAKFLARHGKYQASDAVFAQAANVNPASKEVRFATAEAYIKAGRKLDEAKRLLAEYVEGPLTPDDPPREEALKLLKQISGG